jgi:Xaa-Pro aminopeptidase
LTEIEQRRRAASQQLAAHQVDALIVSSAANVRYLSGYAGSNGLMLITSGEAHFFTDPRYAAEIATTITCKRHVAKGPLILDAASVIKRKGFRRIGFEPAWMNLDQYGSLKKALPPGVSLHPVSNLIEDLRAVKSPAEIALIRRSVLANSEAFARTMKRFRVGLSELEIAAELEYQMKALGCQRPAFDTIVAVGERSALPHAHPSSRRVQANEVLLIDMGATLDGYTSDMTRVAYTGTPPKRLRDLYNAVLEAQLAGLNAVRPGVAVDKVDAACREVLKRHKLAKEFVHSTGHGLGLEIHEAPKIGKKDKVKKDQAQKAQSQKAQGQKPPVVLRTGMVITIEPGAYILGFAGIRIEDTALVTERGCEVLTPTSKEFVNL